MNGNSVTNLEVRARDGVRCVVELHDVSGTRRYAPVFLCLPAMGVAASYYRPFATRLSIATGGAAVLADLRGQGTSSAKASDGADFGYREILELDFPAITEALARRYPERPVYLVGHSLGGQLGTLYAARRDGRIAGLVLVASGTAHWRRWPKQQRWKAMLAVHGIRLVSALLPHYPGHRLGFGGIQPRRLMRDWGVNATTGRYRPAGSAVDYESLADTSPQPVLSIQIEQDPIAPAGAIEELIGKLGCANVTWRRALGVVSDRPRRHHFSWARQPDEIVALIREWLPASGAEPRWTETSNRAAPASVVAATG